MGRWQQQAEMDSQTGKFINIVIIIMYDKLFQYKKIRNGIRNML